MQRQWLPAQPRPRIASSSCRTPWIRASSRNVKQNGAPAAQERAKRLEFGAQAFAASGRIGGCERRHRCPKLDGLSSPRLSSPKGSTVPVVSPIPPFATAGTIPFSATRFSPAHQGFFGSESGHRQKLSLRGSLIGKRDPRIGHRRPAGHRRAALRHLSSARHRHHCQMVTGLGVTTLLRQFK